MSNWTAQNLPTNLSGKTYVITGTSSGIGTVMAYQLAKRGAVVIGGNRNIEKAHQALKEYQKEEDDLSNFSTELLDISSLQSVSEFAEKINAKITQIDGLILNAGIMALPRERNLSMDLNCKWRPTCWGITFSLLY